MIKTVRTKRFFFANDGFTLIELLISVAVIGILASIALPSYQQYVLRSHRVEATAALNDIYLQQVAYFQENYHFALAENLTITSNEYYTIAVVVSPTATDETSSTAFEITATTTSSQTSDYTCKKFTINQLNIQTSYNSDNTSSTSDCW